MTLDQILNTTDLPRVQNRFSFNIGSIPVEWNETDGQFNRMASAKSDGLFSSGGKILFDPADVPQGSNLNLSDPLVRETLFHELVHIEQYRRGLLYRLKIKVWKTFYKYEDRPHEKEAYTLGKQLAETW